MGRKGMTISEQKLIIGVDILPQSSPRAKKPSRYAIAIKQGEKLQIRASISRSELIKTVRRYEPNTLATDNLLELASTEKAIIDLLSKIPSKTRIIQVTGSPIYGMTSLTKLAKHHGFALKKHPTPVETATIVAQLASLGVGTEVSVIARETRIIISRARTIGPGGFSQSRYQRRMHGAIQQVSKNILDRLTKASLDFDQYETRTAHGWSRCAIHVYASFEKVSSIVQSEVNRIAGVAVRLSPVKHRSILYLPTEEQKESLRPRRLLVVGIDAGTTVGIAVVDVFGKPLALHSERGMSRGDVIRYLVEFGRTVLVATDVAPAPTFVEKLRNSLKAELFVPQRVLSVVEKRELAKGFAARSELRASNAHQRDALAAVSKVFQTYENKLQLLNKRLQEKNKVQITQDAASLVLQGLSVHDAIEQACQSSELIPEPEPISVRLSSSQENLSPEMLRKQIQRLQRQQNSLQRKLEHEQVKHEESRQRAEQLVKDLKETKRQLDRRLKQEHRELRRDERIRQKDKEISHLNKEVDKLRRELNEIKRTLTNLKLMRRLEIRGEVQPVFVLSHFSQEEIRQLSERFTKSQRKVIYILDPSGGGSSTANQLIQLGVQIIISQGVMSHLAQKRFDEAKIPVLDSETLRINRVDEFAVVDSKQLAEQIALWKTQYEIKEREAAADALEQLVEEYRQERRDEETR